MEVFFGEADYALYVDLMSAGCRELGVEVWAYRLVPNYVHLVKRSPALDGVEIMPYHRLGVSKIERLGLDPQRFVEAAPPEPETVQACIARFEELGVEPMNPKQPTAT